jgi:hypothetical protein
MKNLFNEDVEGKARKKLLRRIEELQEAEILNAWEVDFLDSIHDQVNAGRDLTFKQQERLDAIENKVEGLDGEDDIPY